MTQKLSAIYNVQPFGVIALDLLHYHWVRCLQPAAFFHPSSGILGQCRKEAALNGEISLNHQWAESAV
jgi:hypothetical protein